MKSIYLHCPLLPAADYTTVLETLCPQPVRNVTVYTYADRISIRRINELIEAQKAFGMEKNVRFRNILVLFRIPCFTPMLRRCLIKNSISLDLQITAQQAKKLVKPMQKLSRSGIQTKLWVAETEDQPALYRHFAQLGLPVHLQRPQYTAETADWFSAWLFDPNAQGINTFCDIITALTLDTHSPNCRYASCLGTTYYVDDRLQVYLCPHHRDQRTYLGSLVPQDQLLQQDAFIRLLTDAVTKRSHCTANCDGFAFCQGGCMLDDHSAPECDHYLATVRRIREALLDVYHNRKLHLVNPVVKSAILNALAFGTAFFN